MAGHLRRLGLNPGTARARRAVAPPRTMRPTLSPPKGRIPLRRTRPGRGRVARKDNGMHVKFAKGADDLIIGVGAPWGGPFNGRDIDGEYFTKSTDFCDEWFAERPLLYNHGL